MDVGDKADLATDLALFAVADDDVPRVLLVRRLYPPFIDHWALPGGFLKEGESFRDAARREFTEETNVTPPDDLVEVGRYDDPGRDPRGRVLSIAFAAVLRSVVASRAGSDARATAWMPVATALSNTRLAFDHRIIISDAVRACGVTLTR